MKIAGGVAFLAAACLTGCATPPHDAPSVYAPAHAGLGAASASASRHGPRFSATDWEGHPDDVPLWSNDPKRMTVLREINSKRAN
jgi:hypothetical protein